MLSPKAKKRVIRRGGHVNDTCMCGEYLEGHPSVDPYHAPTDVGSYMGSTS